MTIIVCLEDSNGMMFNSRRQSTDKVLRKRIMELADGCPVYMNEYSKKQFEDEYQNRIICDNSFLQNAPDGAVCFSETDDTEPFICKTDRLIIYRWNRKYPSDKFFTADISGLSLVKTTDFQGSSHDKITEEIYIK